MSKELIESPAEVAGPLGLLIGYYAVSVTMPQLKPTVFVPALSLAKHFNYSMLNP